MPKKGLNIHKRKDGRWEGRLEVGRKPNGTIKYRSVYGKTCSEVKEKIKYYNATTFPDSPCKAKALTFGDVVKVWLENSRIKNKGGTINKYQNLIDSHIVPCLGTTPINEITAFTVNSFLQEKLEHGRLDGSGGLSPSYVRSIMIVVKSTLNFAVDEGICPKLKSPILKPAIPKNEVEVLSHSDQKKLENVIACSDDPTNIGILVSLHTGLRIGEICALSWDDIDFEQQLIKVRHTVARVRCVDHSDASTKLIIDLPKTQASVREIPISETLSEMLKRRMSTSSSSYVVSDSSGFVSPRTFDYRYHKAIEAAGITNVNYHVLRHTFATRCIEAGVDIKSLSEILGHANVSVTLNTYVHSSLEMKRAQLQKLFSLV